MTPRTETYRNARDGTREKSLSCTLHPRSPDHTCTHTVRPRPGDLTAQATPLDRREYGFDYLRMHRSFFPTSSWHPSLNTSERELREYISNKSRRGNGVLIQPVILDCKVFALGDDLIS